MKLNMNEPSGFLPMFNVLNAFGHIPSNHDCGFCGFTEGVLLSNIRQHIDSYTSKVMMREMVIKVREGEKERKGKRRQGK